MGTIDLETLYRRRHRLVRRVVAGSGVAADAVDDVVQDVFVAIHRRWDRAPDEGLESEAFRRWVVGVTRSVAHAHRRGVARRQHRLSHWVPQAQRAAEPPSVESVVDGHDAIERLHAMLSRLDPAQRAAFELVELRGVPARAAAEMLGTNPNTVYSRVRLARQRIALAMAEPSAPQPTARRKTWAAIGLKLGWPRLAPLTSTGSWGGMLVGAGLGVPVLAVLLGLAAPSAAPPPQPHSPAALDGPAAPSGEASDTSTMRSATAVEAPAVATTAVAAAVVPPTVAAAAATAAGPASRAKHKRAHRGRAVQTASGPSPLQVEIALLRDATHALDTGETDLATERLERHQREYPNGVLVPERDRLAAQLHRLKRAP